MAWEVFTGLGIDAAIGLGMAAGSAAGSICALRVVLRRVESHVGWPHRPLTGGQGTRHLPVLLFDLGGAS
jgi:hypothetical protein